MGGAMMGAMMGGGGGRNKVRTPAEIEALSWWLAARFYDDDFDVFFSTYISKNLEMYTQNKKVDLAQPEDAVRRQLFDEWKHRRMDNEMGAMAAHLSKLFASATCHGANVADVAGAKRLLWALVKQDRLPPHTSLEGLELLRQAWCEHDVAVYLGKRYQRLSRFLYALYLLLGITIIVLSVLQSEGDNLSLPTVSLVDSGAADDTFRLLPPNTTVVAALASAAAELLGDNASGELGPPFPPPATPPLLPPFAPPAGEPWHGNSTRHVIFALSLVGSAVLSVQAYLNPTQRASALLSGASSLESLLWLYRTRVGAFSRGSAGGAPGAFSKASEDALMAHLNSWRDDLVSGTDLQQTDLNKAYPPTVYAHYQFDCARATRRYQQEMEAATAQQRVASRLSEQMAWFRSNAPKQQSSFVDTVLNTARGAIASARGAVGGGAAAAVGGGAGAGAAGGLPAMKLPGPHGRGPLTPAEAEEAQRRRRQDEHTLLSQLEAIDFSGELTREQLTTLSKLPAEVVIQNVRNKLAKETVTMVPYDDHQSPVNWGPYIALRVRPAIADYQARIPRVARSKLRWQLLLFACTGVGALLSYLDHSPWVVPHRRRDRRRRLVVDGLRGPAAAAAAVHAHRARPREDPGVVVDAERRRAQRRQHHAPRAELRADTHRRAPRVDQHRRRVQGGRGRRRRWRGRRRREGRQAGAGRRRRLGRGGRSLRVIKSTSLRYVSLCLEPERSSLGSFLVNCKTQKYCTVERHEIRAASTLQAYIPSLAVPSSESKERRDDVPTCVRSFSCAFVCDFFFARQGARACTRACEFLASLLRTRICTSLSAFSARIPARLPAFYRP